MKSYKGELGFENEYHHGFVVKTYEEIPQLREIILINGEKAEVFNCKIQQDTKVMYLYVRIR